MKERDGIDWLELGIAGVEVLLTIVITLMIWQEIGFGSRQETATSNLIGAMKRQAVSLDALAEKENQVSDSLDKMNRAIQAEEKLVQAREERDTKEAAKKPVIKYSVQSYPFAQTPIEQASSPLTLPFEGTLINVGDAPLRNGLLTIRADVPEATLTCVWNNYAPCAPNGAQMIGAELGTLRMQTGARLKITVQCKSGTPSFKIHVLVGGDNIAPAEIAALPVPILVFEPKE